MPYQAVQFWSPHRMMELRLLLILTIRGSFDCWSSGTTASVRRHGPKVFASNVPRSCAWQVRDFLDSKARLVEQDVKAAESPISIALAAAAIEASSVTFRPRRLSVPGGLAG